MELAQQVRRAVCINTVAHPIINRIPLFHFLLSHLKAILPHEQECYNVPVLIGAADQLVTLREKKNVYMVNPHLKYWATWFLLKTFTTSGRIQAWNKQKAELLQFLRMSDGSFRNQLYKLQQLKLITIEKSAVGRDRDIALTSYKEAAAIMGIIYKGTELIEYKPHTYENEAQVFRYLLAAKEIVSNQQLQLDELYRKFQKNCSGHTTEILLQLQKIGADAKRCTTDKQYLQQQLLKLQKIVFREQSEMANVTFSLRADINRSCKKMAADHNYAHAQSASFIKKKLQKLGACTIEKVRVHSDARTRLYVPCSDGRRRDGYKWIKGSKQTAWFLCDQISVFTNGSVPAPVQTKKAA